MSDDHQRPGSTLGSGNEPPHVRTRPPSEQSRTWLTRYHHVAAPMGPSLPSGPARARTAGIVLAKGLGSNVMDVDGNRYVDLAAGFGALLLGHSHPSVLRALGLQAERLLLGLGDVYPTDAKVGLTERLARLYPRPAAVILCQSGADAVSAALKTAVLHTGRPGLVAFTGAYHGLGHGPLAACGLREGYRAPFAEQLNPHVVFCSYPAFQADLEPSLREVESTLRGGTIGAILVEPILGRGGCIVPPAGFTKKLGDLAKRHGALVIADEIWTGLGRAGKLLFSADEDFCPDLVTLGKGLGGGLPISACLGDKGVLKVWQREPEVIHTSTFAGAPLSCATALCTLDMLSRHNLVQRSAELGETFKGKLQAVCVASKRDASVRGTGLMLGIDPGSYPGGALTLGRRMLERGYITSTGGGARDVLVLTPPLNIEETLLEQFAEALADELAHYG